MSLVIESKNITHILLIDGWYKIESIVIDAYEIGFYDKDYVNDNSKGKFFLEYQPEDCSTGFEAVFHNYNDQGGYDKELITGPMSSILAIKEEYKEEK